MFFQLNDATGADPFTLGSKPFLVLGGSENTTLTLTNPTYTTTVTATPTHRVSTPAGGLSQAGKVGVGIGIPFAVLCLGLFGWLIFRRMARSRARTSTSNTDGYSAQYQRPELKSATKQNNWNTVPPYAGGQPAFVTPYEVHGEDVRSEMPGK
jgi:hypothetical protein